MKTFIGSDIFEAEDNVFIKRIKIKKYMKQNYN